MSSEPSVSRLPSYVSRLPSYLSRPEALLLTFVLLVFLELPGSYLIEPDEARYAEIPREMLSRGDWVTPRVNQQPYFEKPPLLYWANALSFELFGPSPYSARLVSRLSAVGTAGMLLFALGRRAPGAAGPSEGVLGALLFLSSLLPFALARLNLIDGLLTAAMTACLLCLREFSRRRDRGEAARGWLAAAAVAAAAGTLAKGLVGAALPALVFILWALMTGRTRRIVEVLLSPAPVVFALLVVPWFLSIERAHPGFLDFFFVREHLGRFTGGAKRSQSVFYFVPVLLAGLLPWLALLPGIVRRLRPLPLARWKERPDEAFFLLWLAVVFVFFSLSRSKLVPYILPLFPAAAALGAKDLARRASASQRRMLLVARVTAAVFLVLLVAQPFVTRDLSAHPFVEAVRRYRTPDSIFVTYHTYLHGLPWELGEPVPMASWVGELRPAYERNPSHPLFWQEPTFWARWNSEEKLIVLARARDRDEFRLRSAIPVTHLLTVRDHVLLANFTAP